MAEEDVVCFGENDDEHVCRECNLWFSEYTHLVTHQREVHRPSDTQIHTRRRVSWSPEYVQRFLQTRREEREVSQHVPVPAPMPAPAPPPDEDIAGRCTVPSC